MLKQLVTLEDTAASHGRSSAALGQAGVSPELNFQEFLDRQWRFLQVGWRRCGGGASWAAIVLPVQGLAPSIAVVKCRLQVLCLQVDSSVAMVQGGVWAARALFAGLLVPCSMGVGYEGWAVLKLPALQTKQQKIEREMEEGRSRGPALSPGTQRILRTQRRSGAAAAQHAAAMGLTRPLQVRLATGCSLKGAPCDKGGSVYMHAAWLQPWAAPATAGIPCFTCSLTGAAACMCNRATTVQHHGPLLVSLALEAR